MKTNEELQQCARQVETGLKLKGKKQENVLESKSEDVAEKRMKDDVCRTLEQRHVRLFAGLR